MSNTIPKCSNIGCDNDCIKSKNTKKYLLYCSTKCKCQHNSIKGSEKRKQTCISKYGTTTNLSCEENKIKSKNTLQAKYGVGHQMYIDSVKEKLKKTKKEKYGDENFNNRNKFMQNRESWSEEKKEQIFEKRKNTVQNKYGVDFVTQSNEFKEKAENTNLKKYGHKNPSKSKEVIEKIQNTMLSKYGKHYSQIHISEETLQKLNDVEFLKINIKKPLIQIADELGVSYYTVGEYYVKHNIFKENCGYNISNGENEVKDYIESLGFTVLSNSRNLLMHRKEIDIYIPEKNIGIEYCGLYWHCEKNKNNKKYHLEKLNLAKEKNMNLIQITDYEWLFKNEIVKSRLENKLGLSSIIFARKCEIRNVSTEESITFLEKTHIQGNVVSQIRYGLYYNNKLVALMTFGKSRFNKSVEYELLRYSTQLKTTVVGGASKLFSFFIKTHQPKTVISYCDLRWNNGNLYEKIGFKKIKDTGPNYWYTKNYTSFESRIKYQKHKLFKLLPIFDHTLSEWENMKNNGYDRFWDCGNSIFTWQVDTN